MIGYPHLRTGIAISCQTAVYERYPFRHIAVVDLNPPAVDRSYRVPPRNTLLDRHCHQLVCPLIQGSVVADEREQHGAELEARDGGLASARASAIAVFVCALA